MEPVAQLRAIAFPHLQTLVDRTGETASLVVPLGDQAAIRRDDRVRACPQPRDRAPRGLPAHLAAEAGPAGEAQPGGVDARYPGGDETDVDLEILHKVLRQAKRQGFAINNQATETGVTAIGYAVDGPTRSGVAAVSVAMPTARYARTQLPSLVAALRDAAQAIERDLRSTSGPSSPAG